MKNLEQIRAANALGYADAGVNTRGTEGGDVVKKLPALIMTNGLLAAVAFAYAKGGDDGWYVCFNHLAQHLSDPQIAALPSSVKDLRGLLDYLTGKADSAALKHATDEALAWLAYARRFVKKDKSKDGPNDTSKP